MAKWILTLALALTVVEGAIRKWVIGSEAGAWSYLAYFSKDILFASLLLFPRQRGTSAALKLFHRSLLLGGGLVAFGGAIACCREFNLVGTALTVRATVVLPFIAYAAAARLGGLRLVWVAVFLAALTFVNCGLGIMQNRLSAEHALNRYVFSEVGVAALDTGVRATGTFSYITGLAVLSSVGIWAGIVMVSLGESRWYEIAGTVTILAGVGCGLATVSRGPIIVGTLLVAAWACFTPCGRAAMYKTAWVLALILVAGLALGLVTGARQMANAVVERHEQSGESFRERVFGQLTQAAAAASIAPLGQGLGTEQVAGNYASTGIMKFTTFEEQLPRLILETGVAGVLGFIIICGGAILSLQVAKRSTEDPHVRAVLLVTQLLLGCLCYTNVVFNHTACAFAWMLFAAVLAAATPASLPPARAINPHFRNRLRRARPAH